jgi:hypothetical protein
MRTLFRCLLAAGLAVPFGGATFAQEARHAGLTAAERTAVLEAVVKSSPLSASLAGSRYRVFAVDSTVAKIAGGLRREAHTLLYDYTHNKTYHVVNDITGGVPGEVIATNSLDTQLPPHPEEYAEARAMVMALPQVQRLRQLPHVALQDAFPVDGGPAPCDKHRCVQVQVNQSHAGANGVFLLLLTVDLSARQIVEVREPKHPTSLAR